MDLQHLALPIPAALLALAGVFACLPPPPRDPDAVERGVTTIMPEDR